MADIDRARLRELAAAARDAVAALDGMGDRPIAEQIALMRARNGALGALEAACTPHDVTALLDALDAAERERDEARERQRIAEVAHGAVLQTTVEIVVKRDALAALLLECHDVATGRQDHTWMGACPGLDAGFNSRDPKCPACAVLLRVEAALAAREPT